MSEIYQNDTQIRTIPYRRSITVSSNAITYIYATSEFSLSFATSFISALLFHVLSGQEMGQTTQATTSGLMYSLFFVVLALSLKLYDLPTLLFPGRCVYKILGVWCLTFLLMLSVVFVFKQSAHLSRGGMLLYFLMFGMVVPAARFKAAGLLHMISNKGVLFGRPAVVIGEEAELDKISSKYLLTSFGLKEMNRFTLPALRDGLVSPESFARCAHNAMRFAREHDVEEIAIAVEWGHAESLKCLVNLLRASPLPVRLLPDRMIVSVVSQRSAEAPRYNSVELQRAPLTYPERVVKRLVDIVLSSLALIILSPILVAIAFAIRIDSSGPVIFRQRRAGFNGRHFTILKFRSMRVMENGEKIVQATRNDDRVTRIGRVIRRTSIDELPQLLNVLQGDMSLIGPRPHALAHDYEYGALLAQYAFRHHVKPGITGWAQVNGNRGETARLDDMKRRIELDLWYINNWSFGLDCLIIIRTCFDLMVKQAY